MPSVEHEALLELFRSEPTLVADVLRAAFDVGRPRSQARTQEANLTQLTPTEYRADLVVAWGDELRVVVEVQLGKDEGKRWSWPLYVAALHARERCPVYLLVVTTRDEVARWASEPIEMGHPGFRLTPWVVGPASFPCITDEGEAQSSPELAVLSALLHARGERGREVAVAALSAVGGLDRDRAMFYGDLVLLSLGGAARQVLEALVANGRHEYRSEFARKYYQAGRAEGHTEGREEGREEGRALGLAGAIVAILSRRGIELSAEQRGLIEGCTDRPTLDRWLERALDVDSVDELLG